MAKCLVCELPSDVAVNIFEQFITLKALVQLDSAMCNRANRAAHLRTLSSIAVSCVVPLDRLRSKRHSVECTLYYDPVVCIHWLMRRGVSLRTMTVTPFRTRACYPHFSQPNLLVNLHTLHVVDLLARDFGWWECLIAASTNLTHLHVMGDNDILFQAMNVVAHCSRRLETLQLEGSTSIYQNHSDRDTIQHFTKDMEMILETCVNLRDVRITARKIPFIVVLKLARSKVAFLVTSQSSEPYRLYVQNCVVVNNLNLAWSRMSHESIEQCIRQNLADFHGPQFLWMVTPPTSFDYVSYVRQLKVLWSIELNDCTTMTADTFTLLMQNRRLNCAKLELNDTIQNLSNDVVWKNRKAQDIELRAFTALSYRTVQRILSCCPMAEIVTVDMPRMPGELHSNADL